MKWGQKKIYCSNKLTNTSFFNNNFWHTIIWQHIQWGVCTHGRKKWTKETNKCMLGRLRAHQQQHHKLHHQSQALPALLYFGVYERRGYGRRHPPTSRPWFYPVVEQHDVTYHRVKPLTWHQRQRHNAKPKRKKTWDRCQRENNDMYRRKDPE